MPLLIKRHKRYKGHLDMAVPKLFVCAQCGSRVIHKWNADGSQIVCGNDATHDGLMSERDWETLHPPQSTDSALQDAVSLDPDVKTAVNEFYRARNAAIRKALWGEGDES